MNGNICAVTTNQIVPGNIILDGGTNLTLSGNLTFSSSTNRIIVHQGSRVSLVSGRI